MVRVGKLGAGPSCSCVLTVAADRRDHAGSDIRVCSVLLFLYMKDVVIFGFLYDTRC
jgi:hypothetical protein